MVWIRSKTPLDLGRRHLPVVGHDVHEPTPLARQLGPQLEGAVDGPDVRGGRSAPATHRVHHTGVLVADLLRGGHRKAGAALAKAGVERLHTGGAYPDPDLVGSQRPGQARTSTVLEVKPPLARTRLSFRLQRGRHPSLQDSVDDHGDAGRTASAAR